MFAAQRVESTWFEGARCEVESVLHLVPGLEIHYFVWISVALTETGQYDIAGKATAELACIAGRSGHEWAYKLSQKLLKELGDYREKIYK